MNDQKIEGLPYDLMSENPDEVTSGVQQIVQRNGPIPQIGSVNKNEWHIAILRSGEGENCRALWLNYESGPSGGHGDYDGMDLGLFADGLDLMPSLGYPPVQFGGWDSPRVQWYKSTAAHNTVVVDDKNQFEAPGHTSVFYDAKTVQAVIARGPKMYDIRDFSRTAVMLSVGSTSFYVVDVFHVLGGHSHTKFFHSGIGSITTDGLNLSRMQDFGSEMQTRNFRWDDQAKTSWSAQWKLRDYYGVLPAGKSVTLRYTDLTDNAKVGVGEGWICPAGFGKNEELWIPYLAIRREGSNQLESTFVSVIEAYDADRAVKSIKRIGDSVEVETTDGKDLITWGKTSAAQTDGRLTILRWDGDGKLTSFKPQNSE